MSLPFILLLEYIPVRCNEITNFYLYVLRHVAFMVEQFFFGPVAILKTSGRTVSPDLKRVKCLQCIFLFFLFYYSFLSYLFLSYFSFLSISILYDCIYLIQHLLAAWTSASPPCMRPLLFSCFSFLLYLLLLFIFFFYLFSSFPYPVGPIYSSIQGTCEVIQT